MKLWQVLRAIPDFAFVEVNLGHGVYASGRRASDILASISAREKRKQVAEISPRDAGIHIQCFPNTSKKEKKNVLEL